jgi:hypothetical protein
MKIFAIVTAGLVAVGCSPPTTEDVAPKLKVLTASAIPGADPTAIEVADAVRSAAKWEWRATVDGRSFRCDADNGFELPSCTPVSS